MTEQRVVLEYKAHVAVSHMHIGGVFTAEVDAAHIGGLQTRDDAQQRGLAAARWAEQGDQFARFDIQTHIAQGLKIAELLADITNFDTHDESLVLIRAAQAALAVLFVARLIWPGRSGGASAAALACCSARHSARDLITSVTSASSASSDATAKAAAA